jgi:hypothetical protein
MARGWESKSVESQMESAAERKANRDFTKSPEQLERDRKRESLELTRRRVLHDIETAHHERHREQLRAALAFLDAEIAGLDSA